MIPETDSGPLCSAYGLCTGIPICQFWLRVVAIAAVLRLRELIGGAAVCGDAELGLGVAVG